MSILDHARVRTEHRRRAPRRPARAAVPATSRSPRRPRSTPATPTSSPTGRCGARSSSTSRACSATTPRATSTATTHDPRAVVLVARDGARRGARRGPPGPRRPRRARPDLGWWTGSRLVVAPTARRRAGSASAPRSSGPPAPAPRPPACCASRPTVQAAQRDAVPRASAGSGCADTTVAGRPHVLHALADGRIADLVAATKAPLGELARRAGGLRASRRRRRRPGAGQRPRRGVRRDPARHGRARPGVGGLVRGARQRQRPRRDGRGARSPCSTPSAPATRRSPHRVLAGLRAAADAYGVPVLGGHTQLGVPAVARRHRAGPHRRPVPGGGGRPGHGGPAHRRPRRHLAPGLHRAPVGLDHRRAAAPTCARWSRRSGRTRRTGPPRPRTCRWPGSSGRSACSPRPSGTRRGARRRAPCRARPARPWATG